MKEEAQMNINLKTLNKEEDMGNSSPSHLNYEEDNQYNNKVKPRIDTDYMTQHKNRIKHKNETLEKIALTFSPVNKMYPSYFTPMQPSPSKVKNFTNKSIPHSANERKTYTYAKI